MSITFQNIIKVGCLPEHQLRLRLMIVVSTLRHKENQANPELIDRILEQHIRHPSQV